VAGAEQSTGGSIADVVTLQWPLGPSEAEPLLDMGEEIFSALYDERSSVHAEARRDDPFFIIGRKGAGKTAFLVGAALADQVDVILVRSESIYLEVQRVAAHSRERFGPPVADNVVHVWEALLFHVAMLQMTRSRHLPQSESLRRIWGYMSSFGDPGEMSVEGLLAAVAAQMLEGVGHARPELSFREASWALRTDRGSLEDASAHAREVLGVKGRGSMFVVVDNLEDLHRNLDEFTDVITALFRLPSRSVITGKEKLPFTARFAFPAELLPRLRMLAANPDKDFRRRLTIKWTAKELIRVAGHRLRKFLDVYFPDAPSHLGLPAEHHAADSEAAERTLKALLPEKIENGIGGTERPIAYLMRHTQLLPRHLITILNEIMKLAARRVGRDGVPRAHVEDVVSGIVEAENVIVEGILTTYSAVFPEMPGALERLKNEVNLVEPVSQLHHIYNRTRGRRSGLEFSDFLEAGLAMGAFGIVEEDSTQDRYVTGRFSYTARRPMKAVEDRDSVCVHPLFVTLLFDPGAMRRLRGQASVYPYGSDPQHHLIEV
jgi:hypothetical protein